MTQVTMPVGLGGSGNTYSDDGTSAHDMTNGGHRTNLLPMLSDTVAMANSAASSAQSAVNAPGTSGTSTTSLTIGTGSKSLTTQTGKSFVVGQTVIVAMTATPTNWMLGTITAYTSGSGAMTVNVASINGSGTATAWTIGLSAPIVSLNYVPYLAKTAAYTVAKADMGAVVDCSNGSWSLGYTAVATLGANWWGFVSNSGAGTITIDPNAAETINGALTQAVLPGELWLVLCTGADFKAFCIEAGSLRASATPPNPTFPFMLWVDLSASPALLKMRNGANNAWITLGDATQPFLGLVRQADEQNQTYSSFTTTGTAPNYIVTPTPALTSLTANRTRLNITFHSNGTTGSNTINFSGLGALNIKQYDSTGAKQPAVVVGNMVADLIYDGTDAVIIDPLPPTVTNQAVPVRQTVLGGPVDSNGFPSFLPATSASLSITSQNVTSSAPLVCASANGYGSGGAVDRVGQSTTNLTWSGLTASQTNYLYVDVGADGSLTTGKTTLAPTYQWGGTRSTTNGQATYNIQEAYMSVGNGSTAPQAYRVFVGEAVTNASTVTSTVAYAYRGKYVSGLFGLALSTLYSQSHNLGVQPMSSVVVLVNQTAELGFTAGDEAWPPGWFWDNADTGLNSTNDKKTLSVYVHATVQIGNKTTGSIASITLANWKLKAYVMRGW